MKSPTFGPQNSHGKMKVLKPQKLWLITPKDKGSKGTSAVFKVPDTLLTLLGCPWKLVTIVSKLVDFTCLRDVFTTYLYRGELTQLLSTSRTSKYHLKQIPMNSIDLATLRFRGPIQKFTSCPHDSQRAQGSLYSARNPWQCLLCFLKKVEKRW